MLVVVIVAAIGTYLIIGSHAASPYASSSADSGSVASGAVKQSCSGANDEDCVVFNGSGNGGGGLGGGANMLVGVNEGTGHGTTGAEQAAEVGGFDRLDATGSDTSLIASTVKTFSDNKVKVDLLIGNGSASSEVTFYKEVCQASGLQANECPTVEVENEPDLNGVSYQTYAVTLEADYKAFHAPTNSGGLGAASPAIIGAYEGSSNGGGSYTWGQSWWNWDPDTNSESTGYMKSYVDAVYVHPYGHHNSSSVCTAPYSSLTLTKATQGNTCSVIDSALGDRGNIIQAHSDTGKPIYVTEVGWPASTSDSGNVTSNSVGATGDSFGWPYINCANSPGGSSCSGGGFSSPQGDQCDNVYNFVTWTRALGYVYGVTYFGINDYISNGNTAYYGLLDLNGNKKPAFNALAAAATSKPNPCPNPLSY